MPIDVPSWVQDAVFYQIFPDRFAYSDRFTKPAGLHAWDAEPTYHNFMGGDLYGIVEKLDYLVDLGINAVYLNPIFMSASNHRYHTADYFRVDPLLGGEKAFDTLVDALHARNIRVILDGVFNHASRGFFQFNHLMESGEQSPYKDWFHIYGWPVNGFNESIPPNYAAWWGLHALPKFNTDNPMVREYLWSAATYWLEKGIDGWRLDVPNEIDDDAFWQAFRRRCRAINPDCYIVGELWGDASRWLQGDQFDAQMNYPFARAALGFILGDNMDQSQTSDTGYGHMQTLSAEQYLLELDRIFNKTHADEIVFAQMNMLGSHDTPRIMTLARNDVDAVKLLFTAQLTVPGAPNIYYADEIGLAGRHDPFNRRTFPWQDVSRWDEGLLEHVKRWTRLRHAHPVLRNGRFVPLFGRNGLAIFRRINDNSQAVVLINSGTEPHTLQIPWVDDMPTRFRALLTENGDFLTAETSITVAPKSSHIWLATD